ncbi:MULTISPECIES: NYN domain-containing protein [unclassified Rathayibacter]|uniref:NYN domain-containing protein n=1 Tax=unclassified Rathayibacter TaxID=2609250 RepID=UPI001FB1C4FD|nr:MULTISPECIES: NYN domain-containing protein [unclassified Rathayibacter]MCJ1703186.1 NYN domain-containing protein [Rathayibacter sp. VKM Ac-2926]
MRVGVYIDGFNLYYGARRICGRGTPGWRWLDLRALAAGLLTGPGAGWGAVSSTRIVFCTARVSGASHPQGQRDQDTYLRALQRHGSIDVLALGSYVSRVATAPLATPDRRGRPVLSTPSWPLMIRDRDGADAPGATFMASIARREEKGSDVNVASHLLIDVLERSVDAPSSSATTAISSSPSAKRVVECRSGWSTPLPPTAPARSRENPARVRAVTGGTS